MGIFVDLHCYKHYAGLLVFLTDAYLLFTLRVEHDLIYSKACKSGTDDAPDPYCVCHLQENSMVLSVHVLLMN